MTERGSQPFWDDRLTRAENKIVEMARNGFDIAEIADELEWGDRSVSTYARHIRAKGVDLPYFKRRSWARVPTERLVHHRDVLRKHGVKWGLHRMIGERVGMNANTVAVRLWQHDQRQKAEQGQAA